MKAYQCSKCALLQDNDEVVSCTCGIDARPNHRCDGDREKCLKNYEDLAIEERWHERFSWE